jgi:hypothetical protein
MKEKKRDSRLQVQGELEVDVDRGVIYFHAYETGTTILRICRVNLSGFSLGKQIDITKPECVSIAKQTVET